MANPNFQTIKDHNVPVYDSAISNVVDGAANVATAFGKAAYTVGKGTVGILSAIGDPEGFIANNWQLILIGGLALVVFLK